MTVRPFRLMPMPRMPAFSAELPFCTVRINTPRLHGSLAHQEVIFGTVGQYLTLRHDTTDYRCFTPGILLALRKMRTLDPGVTVGLESLLGV